MVQRLWEEEPRYVDMPWRSCISAARYRYDPVFRAAEIERRRRRGSPELVDDGTLTPAVLAGLFAAAHECPYCHKPMRSTEKTLDHVVPKSRGGVHGISNVAVCCRRCNSSKGARPLLIFLAERAA